MVRLYSFSIYFYVLNSIVLAVYSDRVGLGYQANMYSLIETWDENNFTVLSKDVIDILECDLNECRNKNINQGKELKFVRKAIELFIPEYQNLQVKREPEPRMELTKNGKIFNLNQLSDGEKTLLHSLVILPAGSPWATPH